jgi:MOSC domain-containing protein YiiM
MNKQVHSEDKCTVKGKIEAVCLSNGKNTSKHQDTEGELKIGYGMVGDAHAGTKREISLLAIEAIREVEGKTVWPEPGTYAENLTTSGIVLEKLPIGTKLAIGEKVVLEVIQIGKACHSKCEIFKEIGDCIMPRKGIFARIVSGGIVTKGHSIQIYT